MSQKRHNLKETELNELIGKDNTALLMGEFGGKFIYIPRLKKHDNRLDFLKNLQYMKYYLEDGMQIDDIINEYMLNSYQQKFLKGFIKYCSNRHITNLKGLLYALQPFSGKSTMNVLLLIGSSAFAALLEQYAGKALYVPKGSGICTERTASSKRKKAVSDSDIAFDILSGLSAEQTAVKHKVSRKRVNEIIRAYCPTYREGN